MKPRLTIAAFSALTVLCLTSHAEAGCVISSGGKSIDVVTDNGDSNEKTCSVSCQVDTKIGVVQVSCGGTTPPLATAHSLCNFDKSEPWYNKVVSSQDSCKGASASAAPPPAALPAQPVKAGTYICRISPDGHSFDAVIANPYTADASCQVNCQISTTVAGTTEQSSCTKNVAAGAGETVLCTHTFTAGRMIKVIGGSGQCYDPTPRPSTAEKPPGADADDDDDAEKLAKKPLPKPPGAHKDEPDVEGLTDNPDKMQAYIRSQLPPEARKAFDQMNKP
jgi:hypothetical protein